MEASSSYSKEDKVVSIFISQLFPISEFLFEISAFLVVLLLIAVFDDES